MKISTLVLLLLLAFLCRPAPAHAYLDPAAGSLLLQVILGGVAGLAIMNRGRGRRHLSRVEPLASPHIATAVSAH